MFPDIVLDRRIAPLELVLIPQTLKNALGGMALLPVPAEIVLQPLINEAGEAIKFGPLDICRSLISGRDRKHHHLLHARARNPEMASCHPFAHAAPTREADLQI